MKTQGWYKVIKDEEYFKEFLGIFSEFHDYRITHIEYDFEKNHLMLYLRYDTDEEGAVLKFINVKEMHICPCDDYEVSWLFGSGLKLTPSNSLFWYNVDDEDNIDEIKKDKNLTWIESEQIIFAWLDKDNQVVPLTDEQLNRDCESFSRRGSGHFLGLPKQQFQDYVCIPKDSCYQVFL